jgi:hypothetical protein
LAFQPSAWRMFAGEAQTLLQDSVRPSATTDGSPSALCSSACIAPTPHAFNGCEGSVQFGVSTKGAANPVKAETPFPERTFQNATFTVSSANTEVAGSAIIMIARAHEYTRLLIRLVIGSSCWGER